MASSSEQHLCGSQGPGLFPSGSSLPVSGGNNSREAMLAHLRGRIHQLETGVSARGSWVIGSGCAALDRLLPEGGFRRGSLVEWIESHPGGGAGSLALQIARQACQQQGVLVVMDRWSQVYPPAVAAWGIDLGRVIWVQPRDLQEELWCWDQALRSPAVAAVWGELRQLDSRAFRRLQLAVEGQGSLGLLLRPAAARNSPSWADLRLGVESCAAVQNRRIRVQVLSCRGSAARGQVDLEWEEWSGQLRKAGEAHTGGLVTGLADPAAACRSTGA